MHIRIVVATLFLHAFATPVTPASRTLNVETVSQMAEFNALTGKTHPAGWPNFDAMHSAHHRFIKHRPPMKSSQLMKNNKGLDPSSSQDRWLQRVFALKKQLHGDSSSVSEARSSHNVKAMELHEVTGHAKGVLRGGHIRHAPIFTASTNPGSSDAPRHRRSTEKNHVEMPKTTRAGQSMFLRGPSKVKLEKRYESQSETLTGQANAEVDHTLEFANLTWMHLPETGVSFANVLASWACPTLDSDDFIDETHDAFGMLAHFVNQRKRACSVTFPLCDHQAPLSHDDCNSWANHEGQFVALFRQPEQRILSGFKAECPKSKCQLGEYSASHAGCYTKMINGMGCEANISVTGDMVRHANDRLKGFAFVGLTEEWALSVCLFHAMFGGECQDREFLNVHPGVDHSDMPHDVSEFNGWVDPWDNALYARASSMFWNNVAKYGVTPESCVQMQCKSSHDAFRLSLLKQR